MKAKEKAAKPEAEAQAATCKCGLTYHPGCSTLNGGHNHGPWWPRAKCPDEDCRMRTPGWNLPNVRAKRRGELEESGSRSGLD